MSSSLNAYLRAQFCCLRSERASEQQSELVPQSSVFTRYADGDEWSRSFALNRGTPLRMFPAAATRTVDLWRESNSSASEKTISQRPRVFVVAAHSNDSRPEPGLPNVDPPMERTSGIVPGLIAAALFIAFLLGLYTILWKCMVSQPNRRKKMRRMKICKKPDQAC